MRPAPPLPLVLVLLLAAGPSWAQDGGSTLQLPAPTVVHALAVAQTPDGFVGSVSTVSITVAPGGSGHVFVDTSPLAQVDMQGSARLAVRVASSVTGIPSGDKDIFFVVRSEAPVIGGPSAGGIMTVGTIAALEGWAVNESVMMTGTINPSGDIGPIGGLLEKIEAAEREGATLFLFPEGQENVSRLGEAGGTPVSTMDHCARLGIACVAVGQVEEAVRYVTGHEFERRPVTGNVTSEGFVATMRPLAANLTARARNLTLVASGHFDRTARTLPANLRTDLQTKLSDATHSLVQAEQAYADGRYYTASSRSYQASVQARYVDSALGLVESRDKESYMESQLERAGNLAHEAVLRAKVRVTGVGHLEGVGAAQERATEAEQAAEQARAAYQQSDAYAALQLTAQTVERSESVSWWLDIAASVREEGAQPMDPEQLNRTARDLVDTARSTIVYADVLLQESAGPSGLSGSGGPQDYLDRAEQDLRRDYAPAAIFEAIQAEVRASAAVELLGSGQEVQEAKVARAKERAAEAIEQARLDGFEPLLAQSYYEFAGDLAQPEDALAFYASARSVALLGHSFFTSQAEPRASRFVGFAAVPDASGRGALAGLALSTGVLAFAFVLGGLLGGTLAALVLLMARRPGPSPAPRPPPPPGDSGLPVLDPFLADPDAGPAPPELPPSPDAPREGAREPLR
jgi:uncharacterized protein